MKNLKRFFIFAAVVLLFFASTSISFAELNNVDPTIKDRVIKVSENASETIYMIEPTLEEQQEFSKERGLEIGPQIRTLEESMKTEDLLKKLNISSYRLDKVESGIDENGYEFLAKYYTPVYTDGDNLKVESVSPSSLDPGQGAVRIYMTFDRLSYQTNFDSVRGLKSSLSAQYFNKSLSMVTGQLNSQKVWVSLATTLFTGSVAKAIDSYAIGDGMAQSYYRTAYKSGQVYTNGAWKTYYQSNQYEVFWAHKQFAYNSSTNQQIATNDFNYLPANGYLPIEWVPQYNFADNNYILSVAKSRYNSGLSMAYDHGFRGDYWSATWNVKGSSRNY